MITERSIINFLIIAFSFILVPILISDSLKFDYVPALCLVGLTVLLITFFFIKEKLSFCPLLGGSVAGTLNLLPWTLGAGQVACILLVIYYFIRYVLLKQQPLKLGNRGFFWPIMTVALIVLYHNHSLSFGAMGSSTEGARPAFFIYLGVIAYFFGINLPTPSLHFITRIPFYALVTAAISSLPFLISSYFPSTAPYFYIITSGVNVEAYVKEVNGIEGSFTKLGALGAVGASLQIYLLAYYPIGTWLRPFRLWIVALSLLCMVFTSFSGYRSQVFAYLFPFLVATWCYYSWRTVFLPLILAVFLGVFFFASSNNLIHLPVDRMPFIVQRTLSFLPADWDPAAIESGKGSNEFRDNIQDVYLKEYFYNSPLLGNGFDIDVGKFESQGDLLKTGGGDIKYMQAKVYIEGKMFHTGWISVYDCVGLIGMALFITLGLTQMLFLARLMRKCRSKRQSSIFPVYVWIQCQVVTTLSCFFTVFGSFSDTFFGMVMVAIVLHHLDVLAKSSESMTFASGREAIDDSPEVSRGGYAQQY